MTQVNTADLTGAVLDWAVTKCEGKAVSLLGGDVVWREVLAYSTKWAYGGPIIEREQISIVPSICGDFWAARKYTEHVVLSFDGATPLIAAMRCYVASKAGNTIDIPETLIPRD
jgi:hypothetical protein